MNNEFFSKVFLWLFVGLLVTFTSGYLIMQNPSMIKFIFSGSMYWIIFLLQIGLCIFLTARIHKMNPTTAKVCYVLYCFLTGTTFSSLFLIFELESIIYVFLVTSLLLGVFGFIGYKTKIDLTKFGIFLLIALIGIIVLQVINMFILSNTLNMVACVGSLVIFLGYMAWDVQKIKKYSEMGLENDNMAIIGAFELYLDFINVFIDLLRLFGKSKD